MVIISGPYRVAPCKMVEPSYPPPSLLSQTGFGQKMQCCCCAPPIELCVEKVAHSNKKWFVPRNEGAVAYVGNEGS